MAVIGKPNVGKSSFVNRLFGEERVVVSEIAGTTRDPVDTPMQYHGKNLVFVDTAGLRRQSKVKDSLEYYSALRTARVVQQADVCLVLVDATEETARPGPESRGAGMGGGERGRLAREQVGPGGEGHPHRSRDREKEMRQKAPFLQWVPILFTSALTGQRARKALDLVLEVQEERHRRIETHEVNEALE